jgi:predicted ATP-grasp superfamily ATP-dependent carboligase
MKNKSMKHNVIVLGSHTTALYIVRSLGRCGAKIVVIDAHYHGEARFSKYCSKFEKIERFDTDRVIAAINRVSETFGPCAIFPSNDEAAKALSQGLESIADDHVAVIAPWPITLSAYDKRSTYEFAKACDVPMPRTYHLDSNHEIDDVSRQCEYPVLIKPTTTAEFRATFGSKAIGAETAEELKSRFARVIEKIEPSELLIQEFVPGTNRHFWHYGTVFKGKEALVEYVISRRRQYPIDFGTASHAEIVDNAEVQELGARILAEMEFVGPAEVQFKYDKRNGTYKLLDVNPRFWKSCAIAELLGINMPLLAYELFANKAVQQAQVSHDGKLVWFDLLPDIVVSAADIMAKRTTFREWRDSYTGRRIEATFARDDWLPGLVLLGLAPYLLIKGAG